MPGRRRQATLITISTNLPGSSVRAVIDLHSMARFYGDGSGRDAQKIRVRRLVGTPRSGLISRRWVANPLRFWLQWTST